MNGIPNFSFMNGQFTNFQFHLHDFNAKRTLMASAAASTFSILSVAKHEPDGIEILNAIREEINEQNYMKAWKMQPHI